MTKENKTRQDGAQRGGWGRGSVVEFTLVFVRMFPNTLRHDISEFSRHSKELGEDVARRECKFEECF